MGIRRMTFAVGVLLVLPLAVHAQVSWEAPLLTPPHDQSGTGVYMIDADNGGLGAMVRWRAQTLSYVPGVRVGLAEDRKDGGLAIFGGLDFTGALTRSSYEFPLDIGWVLGGGAAIGDAVEVAFPAGLTVGHTFTGDGVSFTPFAIPRVVLAGVIGGDDTRENDDDDDVDLGFGVDIGLDVAFQPRWLVRFSAGFGDRDAIAIGIVWR